MLANPVRGFQDEQLADIDQIGSIPARHDMLPARRAFPGIKSDPTNGMGLVDNQPGRNGAVTWRRGACSWIEMAFSVAAKPRRGPKSRVLSH